MDFDSKLEFTRYISNQFDIYHFYDHYAKLTELVKEPDYTLEITKTVTSNYALFFRLEDFKAQAKYLNNTKRGAGKDNDFTIIDDQIFQFEIKKASNPGKHHVIQQFEGGRRWLAHLLPLALHHNYPQYTDIYNIYIFIPASPQRGLSRTPEYWHDEDKQYGIVYLNSPKVTTLSLDKIIHRTLQDHYIDMHLAYW